MSEANAMSAKALEPASAGPATAGSGGPFAFLQDLSLGAMLGIAPFVLFAIMFLLLPMMFLVGSAFVGPDGSFSRSARREGR